MAVAIKWGSLLRMSFLYDKSPAVLDLHSGPCFGNSHMRVNNDLNYLEVPETAAIHGSWTLNWWQLFRPLYSRFAVKEFWLTYHHAFESL